MNYVRANTLATSIIKSFSPLLPSLPLVANSLVKFHISSQLLSQTLAVKTGRGCASLFLRISRHFVGVFLIIVPFLATEMRSSM